MAHGAQDWVARTDLLLQSLSELIVRHKYGALQLSEWGGILGAADSIGTLVSGKGVLLGGYYYSEDKYDALGLIVDDTAQDVLSHYKLHQRQLLKNMTSLLYLLQYDDTNDHYTMALSHEITFESSLKLRTVKGSSCLVYYGFYFAVV